MSDSHSDALVFFGATGDLAYKKIFPSLQAMVKRGQLDVPVIGVAKAGWNLDQLKARARDSVEKHGAFDAAAFETLAGCCAMSTATTPTRRRSTRSASELGAAQRPAHYLAIPPALFGTVVEQLAKAGCSQGRPRHRREAVRPRSGFCAGAQRDSARTVSPSRRSFASITISASARAQHGVLPLRQCVSRIVLESAATSRACRSRWPRTSAFRAAARSTTRRARSATWCRTTCSRCWRISRWSRRRESTANRCATRR